MDIDVGHLIETPIMGKVSTHQNNIAGFEPLDVVAHELGAPPLLEVNELHFGVKMPFIVDIRYEIAPNAERVSGLSGNL
jgi:hypothetical protein